jgi:lipid II:glycine glycyltransferase (peptidoglycan interpeptide bridge formation enzyme)
MDPVRSRTGENINIKEKSFGTSNGVEIKEIVEKNIWENFLLQCKEKTFLDSWNWQNFNEKMARKSWRFGIYNGNNLISIFLVSKIGAKRSTFLFIPHGPVILENILLNEKKDILKIILQNLKKLASKERASFIRISPIWERTKENQEVFKELGFRLAPIHMHPEVTWELDISLSVDNILKNMRKTTRYLIRQAEKNNDIEIIKSERLDDLKYFNHIYKETGKRQKFVVYKEEYIKNEFLTFLRDKEICLFLGKYKGEVAVTAIFVFWQNGCFYHHSGSLPEYNKFPVSYLLQWEAIKEAKRRGCNVYNFWGIADRPNHPWAGLSLFKMGFGGEKREYVKTQDYIISQKYWINYLIEVARKIKRGL